MDSCSSTVLPAFFGSRKNVQKTKKTDFRHFKTKQKNLMAITKNIMFFYQLVVGNAIATASQALGKIGIKPYINIQMHLKKGSAA